MCVYIRKISQDLHIFGTFTFFTTIIFQQIVNIYIKKTRQLLSLDKICKIYADHVLLTHVFMLFVMTKMFDV